MKFTREKNSMFKTRLQTEGDTWNTWTKYMEYVFKTPKIVFSDPWEEREKQSDLCGVEHLSKKSILAKLQGGRWAGRTQGIPKESGT